MIEYVFENDVVSNFVFTRTGGKQRVGTGLGIAKNGVLVGGVVFEDYNGVSIVGHMAGDGNWATRRFLWMIFDYPFEQLGVSKIIAPVISNNTHCLQFIERLGFREEARITNSIPPAHDAIFMTITKADCKPLRWRV